MMVIFGATTWDYWVPLFQVQPARISFFHPWSPPREGQPYVNSLGMTFQWIPPGEFNMVLSNPADSRYGSATTPRKGLVRVASGFWIGKTKCPREMVELLYPEAKDRIRDYGEFVPDAGLAPLIRWSDAMEFCRLLTLKEHENGLSPLYLYTLPTEVQWAYACEGLVSPRYAASPSDLKMAPENRFGLQSVSLHWWEFCIDGWRPKLEDSPDDERAWLLQKQSGESLRVIRCKSDPASRFDFAIRYQAPQDDYPTPQTWFRPVLVHKDVYARLVDERLLGWPPEPEAKTAAPSSRR